MVLLGFIPWRISPSISKLVLDISGTHNIDAELREKLCRGVPSHIYEKGKLLRLVVPINSDGKIGFCQHTGEFTEDVPSNLIAEDMKAIYTLESLRNIYGGKIPVGPWPLEDAEKRQPCELKLEACPGYNPPDKLGLLDSCILSSSFTVSLQFKIVNHLKNVTEYMGNHSMTLDMALDSSIPGSVWLKNVVHTRRKLMVAESVPTMGNVIQSSKTKLEKVDNVKIQNVATVIPSTPPIKCEDGLFQCSLCKKKFKDRSNCRKHSRIHSSIKLKCTICGALFYDKSNFKVHVERHTRGNTHKCSLCGKIFSTATDLSTHTKTHSKTPRLTSPCMIPDCAKNGQVFTDLRQHLKKSHNLRNLHEYFDKLKSHYSSLSQSGEGCQCKEHYIWIFKWVGTSHNCCLCECTYEFRYVTGNWTRLCKYRRP